MRDPPLCFRCEHFKQYQPLHFVTPGECGWEPTGFMPEWVELWLKSKDRYHGPDRSVSAYRPRTSCGAFKPKEETPCES
jgi:hypothetical protein